MSVNHSKNQYDQDLSDKYSAKYRFDHPHQFMAYSTWLEEVGNIQGMRVLDLACGSGTSSRMLAERGAEVVGVDISESMVKLAEKEESEHPMKIKYIEADASVPEAYDVKPFDMVAAAFMLHYAYSREMLDGFLRNVALNLKQGGRFVSINMSPVHPIISPGTNVSHSSKWLDEAFTDGARMEVKLWTRSGEEVCTLIDYHWNKETYEESLRNAGLGSVQWTEVRMHEEGKEIANWEELETNNMLVIIEATKI